MAPSRVRQVRDGDVPPDVGPIPFEILHRPGDGRHTKGVMEQLGLVEYTLQPFRFQLIPSGKVSLESSMLRAKLLQMKDEGGKPF